jgi:hypothetical protein
VNVGTLLLILLPFGALFALTAMILRRSHLRPDVRVVEPWWAQPSYWLVLTALFVVLGVTVAPRILGGVFLFLPFVWMRGSRPRRNPRSHSSGPEQS